MKSWITKQAMEFESKIVPHINWESFVPLMDIWGRLVMTKDFETGKVTIEVQREAEDENKN